MKRIFAFILSLAMMLSLIGCDSGSKGPATDTDLTDEDLQQIIAETKAEMEK